VAHSNRKDQHIKLTSSAQTGADLVDPRFNYEPLLSSSKSYTDLKPVKFLNKTLKAPIWISSMTGGGAKAKSINKNLARIAGEFGFGMGLGSCRSLLNSDKDLEDFDIYKDMGSSPFYANLGIAQLEELYKNDNLDSIKVLIKKLNADGLIIHINPLQEWFQKEGDRLSIAPIKIIEALKNELSFPLIIKEVGQGFGPASLEALIDLNVDAIEFGAFGGTNFSVIESMRHNSVKAKPKSLSFVGHTASEMLKVLNRIYQNDEQKNCDLIISGGIKSSLDGMYYIDNSLNNAIFGMASSFLNNALNGYDELRSYTLLLLDEYATARSYLKVKEDLK